MPSASVRYYFRDSAEIFELARYLAEQFPHSQDVMIGIYELLLNAVEHGNLRMDRRQKADLLRKGLFGKELERCMQLPENKNKYIEVEWGQDDCFTHLSIRDQGEGFDWRQCMHGSADSRSIHGRGLLIAQACGFHNVHFNTEGNSVTCFARHPLPVTPPSCNYPANAPACDRIGCSRRPSMVS